MNDTLGSLRSQLSGVKLTLTQVDADSTHEAKGLLKRKYLFSACSVPPPHMFLSSSSLTEIVKTLKVAKRDNDFMVGVIEKIERNREQHMHIDDEELQERSAFIADVSQELIEIKRGIDEQNRIVKDFELAKRQENLSRADGGALDAELKSSDRRVQENAKFVSNQRLTMQSQVDQQDEDIDELGNAVDRVSVIATNMNTEFKEQNRLLNNFEDELEEAQTGFDKVFNQLEDLLDTKDRCQLFVILMLGLVAVLLLVLVIYWK